MQANPDSGLSARLLLKVVPGASRSEVSGWLGDRLKIRIAAPPEAGKANTAVESLIAKMLQVPPACVKIVAGASSPQKTIEIQGLSRDAVIQKLGPRLGL